MAKERKDRSVSFERSWVSPYPCSSSRTRKSSPRKSSGTQENVKEWEEARCPVCMEHPHNAVLLKCSSHEKGCRPYICDTSYRHSNCFDQFRKSSAKSPPTMPPREEIYLSTAHPASGSMVSEVVDSSVANTHDTQEERSGKQIEAKLMCPLCRGQINGWVVVGPARHFMNAKSRSCASEGCSFSGTYTDLRKHARLEHPFVRPTEADPGRQRDWRRLERQRDLGDLLSILQSPFPEEGSRRNSDLPIQDGAWPTVLFLIRVFRPRRNNRPYGNGTHQRAAGSRPRTTRLSESYGGETGSSSREEGDESLDSRSGSGHYRLRERAPQ